MANQHLAVRSGPIRVGETAPDFTLPDQNRKDWRLSDAVIRGDVVLSFYPMSFTGVCGTEMKCIHDQISQWEGKGATVVGISCDSFAVQKAWADQMGLKQTLLADMHRAVCRGYGFYWPELNVAARGTVVIGREESGAGKVKWVQAREPGKAMRIEEVMGEVG